MYPVFDSISISFSISILFPISKSGKSFSPSHSGDIKSISKDDNENI